MKRLIVAGFAVFALAVVAGAFVPEKTSAACAPSTDYGKVTQTVNIPSTGTYRVWSRIKAPNSTNNSFLMDIDGGTCYTVGNNSAIPANTWTWVNYQNGSTSNVISVSLTGGNHTVVMYGNEPDVQLDRVVFTTDTTCTPTGTGDNCANPPDTTPPVVSITSPSNGATVSGSFTVAASASDDVSVARVEFYVDGTLRTNDTSSPYSTTVDAGSLSVGSHALTARAYDAAGNNVTSSTVSITVADTTAPTVSLTAPAAGATISGTASVTANASDNIGVARVEFFVDGASRGTDTTSPYAISLNTTTLSNGSHSITARAYDAAGNNTTSAARSVTVSNATTPPPDTTAPSVSISNPAAGATVSGSIEISATATDNVGVTRVEFFVDGTLRNTDSSAPFSFSFATSSLTNGTHSVTAKAYDAAGNVGNASARSFTVSNTSYRSEDINQDGKVNLLDFSLLASKFGQQGTSLGRADINADGKVNLLDFSRLASQFGK